MAYKILSGSEVVCDSTYAGSAVNNPVLHMTVNKVWSFEFVLPPDHPFYNRVEEHKTEVAVSLDGEDPIFMGEVYKVSTDFYGQKTVYAEDQLGYFNYAVIPPHRYNSLNVDDIITQMLSAYNSQCSDRPFYKGTITTTHTAHNLAFSTNYDTALTVLQDNIIKKVGGYIYAYYDSTDGKRYLGYKETPDSSGTTQHIKIGYNLLDFVRESDASKLCSILIPLGERLDDSQQNIEGVEKRLTIETDQRQTDRIESASLITAIGRVVKTRIWDSVTDPDSLYTIGSNYLTSQLADVTIEATAFDLNLADAEIERIHLFDNVRVISAPHGLDARFPVMELTLNLNNPSSDKITMGTTELPSISTQTAEASATIADVPTYSDTADIAARRAAEIIQNATHGYIYFHYDANGVLDEIYIKDNADPDNKWWRWNVAGLGYTSDGGTTYEIAMTMAGELISNLGTIGGWEINSSGLYRTVTDPNDSTKRYRVQLYTPDSSNPKTGKVLGFKASTDSGASWTDRFYIQGNGTLKAADPETWDVDTPVLEIFGETNPAYNYTRIFNNTIEMSKYWTSNQLQYKSVLDENGLTNSLISNPLDPGTRVENVRSRIQLDNLMLVTPYLSIPKVNISPNGGLVSYDTNNDVVASYPAAGWVEVEVIDSQVSGGKTKWKVLRNGKNVTCICKRTLTNVPVTYQWQNIYCGDGVNPSIQRFLYPVTFAEKPIVQVNLYPYLSGVSDGWLVTNANNTQTSTYTMTPAYDIARGTSGTISEIMVDYVVYGVEV